MIQYSTKSIALTASALLLLSTLPGLADGEVKVSLIGERMEKMGMKLDTDTVKAGTVSFEVTNDAMKTGHEMILVKLASKDQELKVVPATNRIDENTITSLGEVSDLKPGAHGSLKAQLVEGDYVLICNIKGHYQAGMYAKLTVTK